jgi:regulator of protease activity HflC (stomatin/prohibitin superfamily)
MTLEELLKKQKTLAFLIRDELNLQYCHLQEELIKDENNKNIIEGLKKQEKEKEKKEKKEKDEEEIEILDIKEKEENNQNEIIGEKAKLYLEEYLGIKIGNINLEKIDFPKEFTDTKIKIQQNHYLQLQYNVENDTKLLKQENDQKLIKIGTMTESEKILTLATTKQKETIILTETESTRILTLASTRQKETIILTETETDRIVKLAEARKEERLISAQAQAQELEILNKSIKENPESYQLKILTLSSEAWKYVGGNSGSKLIISNGEFSSQPLNFINQSLLSQEMFKMSNDKKE